MRIIICLSVMICAVTFGVFHAQETKNPSISVRPVQIITCDDLPSGLDFMTKPMGYKPGFQIYYLLEGENLIGIKSDSLVLDFINTASGADILKQRSGKPAYKLAPFPKTSEDGRYGIFSIVAKQNQFGKLDGFSIKGTITILTASKHEKKSIELPVAGTQKKNVGPFSVKIDSGGESPMGFGPSDNNTLSVTFYGPLASIIEVKVFDSDQELNSQGATWDNTFKTFSYSKPKSDKVTLKVNYWTDQKEVSIAIGK